MDEMAMVVDKHVVGLDERLMNIIRDRANKLHASSEFRDAIKLTSSRNAADKTEKFPPSHCRSRRVSDRGIVAVQLRAVKGCPMSA
jgi:hypothetical protein